VYFLANNIAKHSQNPEECNKTVEEGKRRVTETLKNAGGWKREVDRMAAEIHIAVIRKYIEEAGDWLFFGKTS
jgi:hypothetical protein